MRFMEHVIGKFVGQFRHTCKVNAIESRWIEISVKKNHDPELMLEAWSLCECGETLIGYFPPDTLGYGPEPHSLAA